MTKKSRISRIGRVLVLGVKISTSINERVMNHYINSIKTTTRAEKKTKRKSRKAETTKQYDSVPMLANTFYVLHSAGMDRHESVLVTGIEQSVFYTKTDKVRKQFDSYLTQESENVTAYGRNLFVYSNKIEKLIPILEKKTGFTFGGHYKIMTTKSGKKSYSLFSSSYETIMNTYGKISNHHITMTRQCKGTTKPEAIETDIKSSVVKASNVMCDEVV